jgi:hypothetical protein
MYILPQTYIDVIKNSLKTAFTNLTLDHIQFSSLSHIFFSLSETLSQSIREAMIKAFESIDATYYQDSLRKQMYESKGKRPRRIMTIFGEISFDRYYYVSYATGKGFYYLDHALSLPLYDYYDPCIKAMVLSKCADHPYAMSAKLVMEQIGYHIGQTKLESFSTMTRQTVYNIIKRFDTQALLSVIPEAPLISSDTIYIQLDEKYVPLQDKTSSKSKQMVKLAVIYTSKHCTHKKRFTLENRFVLTSLENSHAFTEEILSFLDEHFDLNQVETLVITGDGALWIKQMKHYLRFRKNLRITYILDRFHTQQAINHITMIDSIKHALRRLIMRRKKKRFKEVVELLMKDNPDRRDTIQEKLDYILSNWHSIQNQYLSIFLGCSVEGHVSHILAALFTSRPKAYSIAHLEKLSVIRSFKSNKQDVQTMILNHYTSYRASIPTGNPFKQESTANVPYLTNGKKSFVFTALKHLSHNQSLCKL